MTKVVKKRKQRSTESQAQKKCISIKRTFININNALLQLQSQPDNLVTLPKFKSLSLFISLEIDSLYGIYTEKFAFA